jgi:hypothetical protein
MSFQAIHIEPDSADGLVSRRPGITPQLVQTLQAYQQTPRALVWRSPSPDWRLFILVLPLATRWPDLCQPVLGPLVRDWGHALRFVGVDRTHHVYDFRAMLELPILRRLIDSLDRWLNTPKPASEPTEILDVLFDILGGHHFTRLEARNDLWAQHLARELCLDPLHTESLFQRATCQEDLMRLVQEALRRRVLDMELYGRLVRAIDRRETFTERLMVAVLGEALDPTTLQTLNSTRSGAHLGCYNWLLAHPARRRQRAYVLNRLPALGPFIADFFLESPPSRLKDRWAQISGNQHVSTNPLDTDRLLQAIDSGQDRTVIAALASHFNVREQVFRSLWRFYPSGLIAPPSWHLPHLLQRLNQLPDRFWPRDASSWQALTKNTLSALVP